MTETAASVTRFVDPSANACATWTLRANVPLEPSETVCAWLAVTVSGWVTGPVMTVVSSARLVACEDVTVSG